MGNNSKESPKIVVDDPQDAKPSFSFKGWNLLKFIKGRKKILIAIIGYIVGYAVTQDAALAAILVPLEEGLVAALEYFCKKK